MAQEETIGQLWFTNLVPMPAALDGLRMPGGSGLHWQAHEGTYQVTAHSLWERRSCPIGGCSHTNEFTTKATLRMHLITVNDAQFGLHDSGKRGIGAHHGLLKKICSGKKKRR